MSTPLLSSRALSTRLLIGVAKVVFTVGACLAVARWYLRI